MVNITSVGRIAKGPACLSSRKLDRAREIDEVREKLRTSDVETPNFHNCLFLLLCGAS